MIKTTKNILYLSYDGMTDPLGQSQVIPYLLGLSKKGFCFTLISFEKPDSYKRYNKTISLLIKDHDINWIPLIYHKFPPIFSTLLDLWIMGKKAEELHRVQGFSIIHCRSYLSSLVGLRMKRKFGTKFLFDMRGFWADERVEGNLWNLNNPIFELIYRFFKRKEKSFIERADYIISLTEAAKREIHSWTTIRNNPVRIEVIPCCVDLNIFSRQGIKEFEVSLIKQELNIQEDSFILLYLGSLGTWYMHEEMLDFFKVMLKYKSNAYFLFVSKDNSGALISSVRKKGIPENKVIVKGVERMDLPSYLSIADLSIFFIKPVFSKKGSSPTKQGELMAMGIPLIINADIGDAEEIIQLCDAGMIVHDFEEKNYRLIAENIGKLINLNKNVIVKGARNYFSLESGVEKYYNVYQMTIHS